MDENKDDINKLSPKMISSTCYPNIVGTHQIRQRACEDVYKIGNIGAFTYYAIFDGHGGPFKLTRKHVAQYCADNLHIMLEKYLSSINLDDEVLVCKAIIQAFIDIDIEMYTMDLSFGSTCTCLLIDHDRNKIYQVNLGDSRSILFIDNNIISVTHDHNPMNDIERSRVIKAGGEIIFGRVNAELMVARSFGDFDLKSNNDIEYDPINGMISAVPNVDVISIQDHMLFLLTSDAPFESISNDKLLLLTNECLNKTDNNFKRTAVNIAKKIKPLTTDDITIIIGRI